MIPYYLSCPKYPNGSPSSKTTATVRPPNRPGRRPALRRGLRSRRRPSASTFPREQALYLWPVPSVLARVRPGRPLALYQIKVDELVYTAVVVCMWILAVSTCIVVVVCIVCTRTRIAFSPFL
jgi:hypothetical protein